MSTEKNSHVASPGVGPASSTAELALFWGTSVRSTQRLLKRTPPAPLRDPAAMPRWYASLTAPTQRALSVGLKRKLAELRALGSGTNPAEPGMPTDYEVFKAQYDPAAAGDTSALGRLKLLRDYSLAQIEGAHLRGDTPASDAATHLLKSMSDIIHDFELRDLRLGRESGGLIERDVVIRIGRAIPFWMLRGVDDLLSVICPRIAAASGHGPLDPEGVRVLVEGELLSARLLVPFVMASRTTAAVGLPEWFVAALRSGLADTLERGGEMFDELHASTPVARPTVQSS